MPLIIIHGNGLTAILNKISLIKKEFDKNSIKEISAKEMSFERAMLDVSGGSLFTEKRLFLLEDFDDSIDLSKLNIDSETTVVLKISKNLSSNSKLLKLALSVKAQIINFTEKEEVTVFPFLDKLAEKKNALEDFEILYKTYGSQYILTMILYLLRRLLLPAKNLPLFILKKMELQKKNFSEEKIKTLYKNVLETDFKIKKGLVDEKTALTLLILKGFHD